MKPVGNHLENRGGALRVQGLWDQALSQPVVLMSIGIDLKDLHGAEVAEDHDFLPHLPSDLPPWA